MPTVAVAVAVACGARARAHTYVVVSCRLAILGAFGSPVVVSLGWWALETDGKPAGEAPST
jgi:hypothetical protein